MPMNREELVDWMNENRIGVEWNWVTPFRVTVFHNPYMYTHFSLEDALLEAYRHEVPTTDAQGNVI